MPNSFKIRQAKTEEHDRILKIAKQSKYTKDFSNRVMFSSDIMYGKGWILVAEDTEGAFLGFACVRHKVREPVTELYFIGVAPEAQGQGVGKALIRAIEEFSPHKTLMLNVSATNEAGQAFYKALGFEMVAQKTIGRKMELAYRMQDTW